ncbi:MAG TPA: type I-E CRISPR-associated protein Cse2/CasB [Bryobacteraceae bacterium]|nr:type I-E CRISPR-associated protein Cse2/CasB [Bryobacteraceae bacterium]
MTKDSIHRFITRLETLGGITSDSVPDRQALASLRRIHSTWPAVPPGAMRVVAPFLPEEDTGWRESLHYLIAALFALHPCSAGNEADRAQTFGLALRKAAFRDPAQGPERRLLALLGCRSEDLPDHLRHAASYLRARDIPIDYRRLMQDLNWWDAGEGEVQRRWGRDFWSGSGEDNSQKPEETTAEETNHVR